MVEASQYGTLKSVFKNTSDAVIGTVRDMYLPSNQRSETVDKQRRLHLILFGIAMLLIANLFLS